MTLWCCEGCGATYSVGAAACPQCGGGEHYEEGEPKPEKKPVKQEQGKGKS